MYPEQMTESTTAPPSMLAPAGAVPSAPPIGTDSLRDLGLDRIAGSLAGRLSARLAGVFTTPVGSVDTVAYRHEVFADLARPAVLAAVGRLVEAMDRVRMLRRGRDDSRYAQAFDIWDVHIASGYVAAIDRLDRDLRELADAGTLDSRALNALRCWICDYAGTDPFSTLRTDCERVRDALAAVRFAVWLHDDKVVVGHPGAEPDLETRVLELFQRFREDPGDRQSTVQEPRPAGMDHVQAAVLERVERLAPEVFADVAQVAAEARRLVPAPQIQQAAEELDFYLAYRELVDPLAAAGLPLCLPRVEATGKELEAVDSWDLPLALSLAGDGRTPVSNTLELHGPERILVVSGPNQGGKTTTARTFGQLHHLASIGCPVPGSRVRIMLADRVITLFEREETAEDFNGRLGGELHRWHRLLQAVTPRTVVVINEIFSSTPLADARILGRTLVEQLVERDTPAVLVTFLDELSRLGPQTVSMVSTLDPSDPTVRTFKVVRRRADGRAYAAALAGRYHLGYQQIMGRLAS